MTEGWRGWDDYAPFYDWENARTLQRRDVAFWQRLAAAQEGPVLELGCGTGRIAVPVARAGARIVGIDRSDEMLARARKRIARAVERLKDFFRGKGTVTSVDAMLTAAAATSMPAATLEACANMAAGSVATTATAASIASAVLKAFAMKKLIVMTSALAVPSAGARSV